MIILFKFQITTDYAIRIIGCLHSKGGRLVHTNEIAEVTKITQPYTMKIINKLKTKGIVKSERGPQGGYSLTRSAEEISLYDVIVLMEGEIFINRCLEPDAYCSRDGVGTCKVNKIFCNLQSEIVEKLKSIYISDVFDEKQVVQQLA